MKVSKSYDKEEREPKIKRNKPKARKKLKQRKNKMPSSLRDMNEDDFDWMYDLEE